MNFVTKTDAEYRLLTTIEKAQYWCDRYNHTQDLLDAAKRELDLLRLQQRRILDILGEGG